MTDVKPRTPLGWIVLPTRIALAALFIFAAWMKLSDPQAFAESIKAFKIIPTPSSDHLTVLATSVVPWTEVIAGVALLLGFWTRASALIISLLLVTFIAGIASVMVRGLDVKCGCFGKFEVPCTGPLGPCQLIRDLIMLAMGVLVVWKGPGPLAIDRESTR